MQKIDGYITIQEVAAMLMVSDMTVRRWINTGKLKAIKINRTIRIAESEVNRIKKGR